MRTEGEVTFFGDPNYSAPGEMGGRWLGDCGFEHPTLGDCTMGDTPAVSVFDMLQDIRGERYPTASLDRQYNGLIPIGPIIMTPPMPPPGTHPDSIRQIPIAGEKQPQDLTTPVQDRVPVVPAKPKTAFQKFLIPGAVAIGALFLLKD